MERTGHVFANMGIRKHLDDLFEQARSDFNGAVVRRNAIRTARDRKWGIRLLKAHRSWSEKAGPNPFCSSHRPLIFTEPMDEHLTQVPCSRDCAHWPRCPPTRLVRLWGRFVPS